MIKNYINLSAGLMIRDKYSDYSIIRIQSSHIESKSWDRLFYLLSDDLLYNLASGYECWIIDCSSNGTGKVIKSAIPVIKYILTRLWFRRIEKQGKIDKDYLTMIYCSLSKKTKSKLRFYIKYLKNTNISLSGKSYRVRKEIND